ncbi:MAG: hypothetical protein ABI688_04210 [Bacteroidota bacterium]
MKKQFLILLFLVVTICVKAQTGAELFQQGATQKKYLLQQIAALQVYIGYVQKGYSIAKNGLNTISDIKHGEFNLHIDYFNSLKTVNPAIRKYAKVAEIIAIQVEIVQVYKNAASQIRKSKAFNDNEIHYLNGVFDRLIDDCTNAIDELIAVTTSHQLEMKDDERLRRIDNLYNDIQGKYTFVQSFSNEAKVLASLRTGDQNDVQTSREINGIK